MCSMAASSMASTTSLSRPVICVRYSNGGINVSTPPPMYLANASVRLLATSARCNSLGVWASGQSTFQPFSSAGGTSTPYSMSRRTNGLINMGVTYRACRFCRRPFHAFVSCSPANRASSVPMNTR